MAINTSASVGLCNLPEAERIECGIHLGGLCFENWYHWSIELASRATFIDLLPLHLRDFPVLVPKWRLPAAPNFRAVLEAAGIGDRLRFVDPDRPIRVKELVMIDSPAAFPVCMRGVKTWPIGSATIHPTAISHFRQVVLSAARVDSSRRSAERRVLLTRRDRPRVANHRSLERIFVDHGFEQIHMEDLGFIDQVRLMSAASTIAGATGAAWSGALFAPAGSRGLCLCDRKDASLGVFPNLAAQAGMDLRYVFGDSPPRGADAPKEHGIHIDPAELARALNALLE